MLFILLFFSCFHIYGAYELPVEEKERWCYRLQNWLMITEAL